jgi:hypothetical protein
MKGGVLSVVFVRSMKQLNTFYDCPMATLLVADCLFYIWGYKTSGCGDFFCSWLRSFSSRPRNLVLIGRRHFAGPYGSVGMIWCFKSHNINLFCRRHLGGVLDELVCPF